MYDVDNNISKPPVTPEETPNHVVQLTPKPKCVLEYQGFKFWSPLTEAHIQSSSDDNSYTSGEEDNKPKAKQEKSRNFNSNKLLKIMGSTKKSEENLKKTKHSSGEKKHKSEEKKKKKKSKKSKNKESVKSMEISQQDNVSSLPSDTESEIFPLFPGVQSPKGDRQSGELSPMTKRMLGLQVEKSKKKSPSKVVTAESSLTIDNFKSPEKIRGKSSSKTKHVKDKTGTENVEFSPLSKRMKKSHKSPVKAHQDMELTKISGSTSSLDASDSDVDRDILAVSQAIISKHVSESEMSDFGSQELVSRKRKSLSDTLDGETSPKKAALSGEIETLLKSPKKLASPKKRMAPAEVTVLSTKSAASSPAQLISSKKPVSSPKKIHSPKKAHSPKKVHSPKQDVAVSKESAASLNKLLNSSSSHDMSDSDSGTSEEPQVPPFDLDSDSAGSEQSDNNSNKDSNNDGVDDSDNESFDIIPPSQPPPKVKSPSVSLRGSQSPTKASPKKSPISKMNPVLSTDELLTPAQIKKEKGESTGKKKKTKKVSESSSLEVSSYELLTPQEIKREKSSPKKSKTAKNVSFSASIDSAMDTSSHLAEVPSDNEDDSEVVIQSPLRYVCPSGFQQVKYKTANFWLEDAQNTDKEFWLFTVPADFDPSLIDGTAVHLDGTTTLKDNKGENSEYKWELHCYRDNALQDSCMNVLLPSKSDHALHAAGPFTYQANITKSLKVAPYILPKIQPRRMPQIPEGLKQRNIPFGADSPLRLEEVNDSIMDHTTETTMDISENDSISTKKKKEKKHKEKKHKKEKKEKKLKKKSLS